MTAFAIIKDCLLLLTPIAVALISYCSNKKSRKEIMNELDARLKEKDNETANEIKKMSAEMEKQKQLSSWDHSMEVTNVYIEEIGKVRYATVMSLKDLNAYICDVIRTNKLSTEELKELIKMLETIEVPDVNGQLYPIEIPIIFNYNQIKKVLKIRLEEASRCGSDKNER